MRAFIQQHVAHVIGVLSGFDRLVFRGGLRSLSYVKGMLTYLCQAKVLLKNFGRFAEQLTDQVKTASLEQAERAGRPVKYLASPKIAKDEVAREIAQRDGVREGLICVLKCVEPCLSYDIQRNRVSGHLELQRRRRQGLHLYHYFQHPQFGLMHMRLGTWLPFNVQVCLNGREWLARQMDAAGLKYERRDNCFTYLQDFAAAQQLCNAQVRTAWAPTLNRLLRAVHPAHGEIFSGRFERDYYWTLAQSEWATDVMFDSPEYLQRLFDRVLRYGMATFGPLDVVRFLGRRVKRRQDGRIPASFGGNVVSNVYEHPEGVRIKHWHHDNSLKAYDKYNNLRFEMTMNRPSDFRVYRTKEGEEKGPPEWLPLRKGIADVQRRAQVSQAGVERMMDAYAAVENTRPLKDLVEPVCRRVCVPGHRRRGSDEKTRPRWYRALNPLSAEDAALLTAISRPEFAQNGLRNRDLTALLYPKESPDEQERRRRSSAVSRKLALLRAHGLLKKVPKTHRYVVSPAAHNIITAILSARNANPDTLTKLAA